MQTITGSSAMSDTKPDHGVKTPARFDVVIDRAMDDIKRELGPMDRYQAIALDRVLQGVVRELGQRCLDCPYG